MRTTLPSQVLAMTAAAAMGFDYSRGRPPPSDPQHPRSRRWQSHGLRVVAVLSAPCPERPSKSSKDLRATSSQPQRTPLAGGGGNGTSAAPLLDTTAAVAGRAHLHTNALAHPWDAGRQ